MPTVQNIKVYENGQWVTKALYFPPSSHDHPTYLETLADLDLRITELEGSGGIGVDQDKVIEIVESYLFNTNESVALPESGSIETIYFNTYLTSSEIVEILSELIMIQYNTSTNYYRAFYGENGNALDIFFDSENLVYYIKYGSTTIWTQGTNISTESISVNDTSILSDWITSTTMTLQNSKLIDLISTIPFYKPPVYTPIEETQELENRVTALESGESGLTEEEVNEIVESNLLTKTAVPNSGYVEKIYFNTKLSVEEVNNTINNANLSWLDFGDFKAYYVCSNSTNKKAIAIFNINSVYIIQVMTETDLDPIFDGENNGWKNDMLSTYNPYVINDNLISEIEGMSLGTQNDLIKDLVYVQSEKYATVEKVESYLFTEEDPTAVPNTGTIEKLYFNTNLSEEEVTNYINNANLNFITIGSRTVYLLAIDTEALNGIGIFKLGENKYAINQANFTTLSTENILFHTSELTNSQNVQGWESELKNNNGLYKATFNTVSSYQNMPIGQQNDLLVNLISLTPFGKQEKYLSSVFEEVDALPENPDEQKIYRLFNVYGYYNAIQDTVVNVVDSLPETGDNCTVDGSTFTVMYYNKSDESVYGYVDSTLASAFGITAGWYPASSLMGIGNLTYGGVINENDEVLSDTYYFIKNYDFYTYKELWTQLNNDLIFKGDGESSVILNTFTNTALGSFSHAEGYDNTASGNYSHAEGSGTIASGSSSHAEGMDTIASGERSHAEGMDTIASGSSSHAEGYNTIASGNRSHAEGSGSTNPSCSFTRTSTEKQYTSTTKFTIGTVFTDENGIYAKITNVSETSSPYTYTFDNDFTTTEGSINLYKLTGIAYGSNSHAEGSDTIASGIRSHAEGSGTIASGSSSHAEGMDTIASGTSSHAEGYETTASSNYQHVQGRYNIEDTSGTYAHIVGNGIPNSPSNAHTLDWNGNAWYKGAIRVGGTSWADGSEVALKSDINQMIADYMTANYENGNEGSY